MTLHPEHDLLSGYLDGDLDVAERGRVEAHLTGCADARALLDGLRATMADMAAMDEPEMDPQISFAIRAALARERKLSLRARRYAWAGGAAAAALIGIVSFAVLGGDAGRDAGAGAASLSAPQLLAKGNLDESNINGVLHAYLADSYGPEDSAFRSDSGAGAAESAITAGAPPEPAPTVLPYGQRKAADRAFPECIRSIERASDSVRLVRSIAAVYKSEDVYVMLFEVPADRPERVELWVTTRSSCEVRYFTQADVPR